MDAARAIRPRKHLKQGSILKARHTPQDTRLPQLPQPPIPHHHPVAMVMIQHLPDQRPESPVRTSGTPALNARRPMFVLSSPRRHKVPCDREGRPGKSSPRAPPWSSPGNPKSPSREPSSSTLSPRNHLLPGTRSSEYYLAHGSTLSWSPLLQASLSTTSPPSAEWPCLSSTSLPSCLWLLCWGSPPRRSPCGQVRRWAGC